MSIITKESIADTIEGLELLANRGIQSVHIDMAIAGMRRLLASLEAEAVHQFIYNNPYEEGYTEWLDCNEDYFNGVPEDCRRILYTAPPAPVSVPDEAISRAVDEIMATYAGSADECRKLVRKHIEDAYRAAMLQGGKS